jgi:hypothetical protein
MASNPAYSTPLHGLTSVELFDAAKQVRETVQSPGWRLLAGLTEAHASLLQAKLTSVSLPSYEAMAALAAEIRGVRAMVEAAETVLSEAQAREEQEEKRVEADYV